MIHENGVKRLYELAATLQAAPTGELPDWKRGQMDGYPLGFDDGQIQGGNDLRSLLDELTGIQPRPDA